MMSSTADQEIRDALFELVEQDETLTPASVEVIVHGGVVTLAGEVPNLETAAAIESAAKSLRGVVAVVNQLAIAPDTDHAALGGL